LLLINGVENLGIFESSIKEDVWEYNHLILLFSLLLQNQLKVYFIFLFLKVFFIKIIFNINTSKQLKNI